MKTRSLIASTGALLLAGALALAAPAGGPDKVDLTPKFKVGDKFTFSQRIVRKDTMMLGNMPGIAPGGDAPKGEQPKDPAPKGDAPKGDTPKGSIAVADMKEQAAAPPPELPAKLAAPFPAQPAANAPPAAGGAPNSSQTLNVDQTAKYELRVIEASDTGASLELELKSIKATAEVASGKFTWDSSAPLDDKDRNNAVLAAYRPIVGSITRIKIGPDGNFTSVQPDPGLNPQGIRGPLASMIQQLVGADGVRLRWSAILWVKDGRQPATVGQTWTNTDEVVFPAVGRFIYTTNNTLKSVKADVADIQFTGDVKLTGAEAGKAPSGAVRDQHLAGSCTWDVAAGMVKSHTWDQKYTIDVDASGFHVSRASEFTVTTTRE